MERRMISKRPSLLSGVGLLTLSSLMVKVMGLFYRIPLLELLGTEGMGYFNTAYELYALLCVLSTAGLPVAMSILISALEAEGRRGEIRRVFWVALALFGGVGCLGTGLLLGGARYLAILLGSPLSVACIRGVAPTVFLICLSSAFRGYFQGRGRMLPTAVSQVMEAGGKLLLGLAFAGVAVARGEALPVVAAYAVSGLTVGTGLSVLYLLWHKALRDRREAVPPAPASPSPVLRPLLGIAVPITLSSGLISLTRCVDVALIQHRLQTVGYTSAEATALYGCYSTLVIPIFNLLPSLTTAVAFSATPALSGAMKRGAAGLPALRQTATLALGVTLLPAIPGALGVSVFAKDILTLLFPGQPEAVAQGAPWLSCLGLSIPFACLVTVTGAMLQAAGRPRLPFLSMLLGVSVKVVAAYILLGHRDWGMAGMPVSSLLCDMVIVVGNLSFLAKHAPAMLPPPRQGLALVALPLGASVGAVAVVRLLRARLGLMVVTPLHTLITVACVVILYGLGLLPAYRFLRSTLIISPKEKETEYESSYQGTT